MESYFSPKKTLTVDFLYKQSSSSLSRVISAADHLRPAMRVVALSLLLGAASASVGPAQVVLQGPKETAKEWLKPLHQFQEHLKSLTEDARQLWDEMALMYPKSFDSASFFSSPKPHTRKHDSEWDHIIKGADVQSVWVENSKGEKEREVDGSLESYNLRTKKVDPSALGVDTVKQYSGYLDDEENDKHLFYCKFAVQQRVARSSDSFLLKGSSNPGTIP